MVVDTCNLNYSGFWGRRIAWTRRQSLQWAEIAPLHSSLGDKSKAPSKQQQQQQPQKQKFYILFKVYLKFN